MTAAASALLALLAAGTAADPPLRAWTRGETPALGGEDAAGRPLELRALRGRVVLVQFWASWCEPCAEELPALERLRAAFADRPFEVLTVNLGEGPARVTAFTREHGVGLPVLLDPEGRAGRRWGVGGLPMAFLVDSRGRVRYALFGECDWTAGEPAATLERLLLEAERKARKRTTP